jgi:glucose/arabinose dehydrogenase
MCSQRKREIDDRQGARLGRSNNAQRGNVRSGCAGRSTGEYEDFMTGFALSDTEVWGAHVDDAVAQDESLFVTEDG